MYRHMHKMKKCSPTLVQADRMLSPEEIRLVNNSMCHDPKTAKRFYVMGERTPKEVMKVRLSILRGLLDWTDPDGNTGEPFNV